MHSLLKRWSNSVTFSRVRRAVNSRRHTLWLLLILVLICIAFQTFVFRQARDDKVEPSFTMDKQLDFSLDFIWGKVWSDSPLATSSDLTSLNTDQDTAKTSSQSVSLRSSAGTCTAKTHIVFLKTHKTASSTILNILCRFGENRNLTFALPLNKNSQLFYPFFFAPHFVQGAMNRRFSQFHILCNHMRFKKSEVAKVMPPDTFYFSILRNPVSMMESVFIYYKNIPAFHGKRTLDDFLNTSRTQYNGATPNNHYAHNLLAFDFGLNNNVTFESPDLEQQVSAAISTIDRDFNLVLISEYFDESMVLLRHALCWSLEDIVSFTLNRRSDRTRVELSPEMPEKIKKWNALDWRIYLHFNASFWHKVDMMIGRQQLEKEVNELKALRAKRANICLKDGGAVEPSRIKDNSLKPFQYGAAVIQGYNLNPDISNQTRAECEQMIMPELQYTNKLYMKQFPESKAGLKKVQTRSRERRHFVKDRSTQLKMPQSALSPHNKTSSKL